ncbi:D-hydantoinase [bioreactor metagenome]|uniref:D-hydantoinase n=1 Tax=bioreactor metagenome TaxID=1076179 RepID=A0A645JN49_9ZZZZ
MLPLMLTEAAKRHMELEEITPLLSENTCKNLGLYPKKGCIAVGSDADFVIVDTEKKYKLSKDEMYTKAKDVNVLFDSLEVQGKPIYTILRGEILMENGVVDISKKGYGRFVPKAEY